MIFTPRKIDHLWDTWLYYHEGVHYLYYLTMGMTERQGMHGQGVAMSTSTDGIHWDEIGVVLPKDEGATGLGTGSIWKAEDFEQTGRFIMNYSIWFDWCIESQEIRFAESTDLIHWMKLGESCALRADPRWYEAYPESPRARWDCIYTIPRPGGGRYGYWTALPAGRPGFGFGETLDGAHWTTLEPPIVEEVGQGECGAIEKLGDRYIMLYHGGNGILYADQPEGPFYPIRKNHCALGGHAYFTRFYPTPDGLLVNHHAYARTGYGGSCCFAPLKRPDVDVEGTFRLAWWDGNEALKATPEASVTPKPAGECAVANTWITPADAPLDPVGGMVVEGEISIPAAEGEQPTGFHIECRDGRNGAILIGRQGVTDFGTVERDGSGFTADFYSNRDASFNDSARFRLLLRGIYLELYLDDLFMACFSLPAEPTGALGFVPGTLRPGASVSVWGMNLT